MAGLADAAPWRYIVNGAMLHWLVYIIPPSELAIPDVLGGAALNGSLWTVYWEGRMYVMVALIGARCHPAHAALDDGDVAAAGTGRVPVPHRAGWVYLGKRVCGVCSCAGCCCRRWPNRCASVCVLSSSPACCWR
jgi:hypothetical protein